MVIQWRRWSVIHTDKFTALQHARHFCFSDTFPPPFPGKFVLRVLGWYCSCFRLFVVVFLVLTINILFMLCVAAHYTVWCAPSMAPLAYIADAVGMLASGRGWRGDGRLEPLSRNTAILCPSRTSLPSTHPLRSRHDDTGPKGLTNFGVLLTIAVGSLSVVWGGQRVLMPREGKREKNNMRKNALS